MKVKCYFFTMISLMLLSFNSFADDFYLSNEKCLARPTLYNYDSLTCGLTSLFGKDYIIDDRCVYEIFGVLVKGTDGSCAFDARPVSNPFSSGSSSTDTTTPTDSQSSPSVGTGSGTDSDSSSFIGRVESTNPGVFGDWSDDFSDITPSTLTPPVNSSSDITPSSLTPLPSVPSDTSSLEPALDFTKLGIYAHFTHLYNLFYSSKFPIGGRYSVNSTDFITKGVNQKIILCRFEERFYSPIVLDGLIFSPVSVSGFLGGSGYYSNARDDNAFCSISLTNPDLADTFVDNNHNTSNPDLNSNPTESPLVNSGPNANTNSSSGSSNFDFTGGSVATGGSISSGSSGGASGSSATGGGHGTAGDGQGGGNTDGDGDALLQEVKAFHRDFNDSLNGNNDAANPDYDGKESEFKTKIDDEMSGLADTVSELFDEGTSFFSDALDNIDKLIPDIKLSFDLPPAIQRGSLGRCIPIVLDFDIELVGIPNYHFHGEAVQACELYDKYIRPVLDFIMVIITFFTVRGLLVRSAEFVTDSKI